MPYTVVPDRAAGYALAETDWDVSIKDNINTGTWVCLSSQLLGADTASVGFGAIAATWTHLMIEASVRTTQVTAISSCALRFNGDAGANYDGIELFALGTSITSAEGFAATQLGLGGVPGANPAATLFGAVRAYIPNYRRTTGHKSVLSESSCKTDVVAGSLSTFQRGGWWRSTAAITSVEFRSVSGNLRAGSQINLYAMA